MNTQEVIELLEELSMAHTGSPPYSEALTHAIEHMKRWHWQPIETAPRDGTEILVIEKGIHEISGKPFIPDICWYECNRWVNVYSAENIEEYLEFYPTHWMPLPPAPEG